jgi:hypothetical protein
MSTVAQLDGHRGRSLSEKTSDCAIGKLWYEKLQKSLRMVYVTDHGGPPRHLDHVVAHVEFHPCVVRAMDRDIGKQWGDKIYKLAFQACQSRAQTMLQEFEDMQTATNRPFFKNALRRFATFASSDAVSLIAKPLKRNL